MALARGVRHALAMRRACSIGFLAMLVGLRAQESPVFQDPPPVAAARSAMLAAEQQSGAQSLEVSDAATGLGNRLVDAGRFVEGAEVFERSLAIRIALLGEDHAKTRVALSNVANARMANCEAEIAIPLLERAIASAERTGTEDRNKVGVLMSLGAAHRLLGQYRQAREFHEAAAAVVDRVCPEHAYAALAKQGLATVLMDYGEVERARGLIEAALAIAEREPNSQPCAHAVFGIGIALGRAGRFDEALPMLRRGLELVQKAFGPSSAKALLSAAILASVSLEAGEFDAAATVARDLLAAAKDRTGLLARARAQAHGVLSAVAAGAGRAEEGLAEARAMLALQDPAWITPTDLARQWTLYGNALVAAAQTEAAITAYRRAITIFTQDAADHGIGDGVGQVGVRSALAVALAKHGDDAAAIAERLQALAAFRGNVDLLLPVMLEPQRLDAVQRHRGNLDALLAAARVAPAALAAARQHAEVLAWKGQVARGIGRSLAAARQQPDTAVALARLQQLVRESGGTPNDKALLRERQALSARLAGLARAPAEAEQAARIGADLGPQAAFVDFLLVAEPDGSRHFVAFVVRAGQPTVRVDLAAHETVRAAVAQHLLITSRRTRAGLGAEALAATAARTLRELVWQPLQSALAGATEIVISPDDVLAELPFETLPDAVPERFLVESVHITYVQSGLELVRPAAPAAARQLLAIGGIAYGEGGASTGARAGVGPFAPLPGAAQEVADVRALFGDGVAKVVTGADATEQQLALAVVGATHVHLATHGFCRSVRDGIAAGVALTGANLGRSASGDDGILTSEEAALLDLRACQLVTLSACQSGLGTPVSGEHLLGLRRSLHIAGARTTLTSLWRVDDAATAALMADFYRALWREALPPAEALRRAQLACLTAQRAAGAVLPGIWGAFVVEGRW